MNDFAYDVPADLYTAGGLGMAKRPMRYRRFERSEDAIRYAIEELPPAMQRSTIMEIGDKRFELDDIRRLYVARGYSIPADPSRDD